MDFYVDLALTVLFRVLKDTAQIKKFDAALCKLRDVLNSAPLSCNSPKP
jgi:hypothetical protein